MNEDQRSNRWWHTVPGILTAAAGTITAVAGLIVALQQAGLFDGEQKASQVQNEATTPPEVTKSPTQQPDTRALSSTDNQPAVSDHVVESATQELVSEQSKRINLLSAENGGHLLVASNDGWTATIDGREEEGELGSDGEAVYAFEGERPATFDVFTMLISGEYWGNIKEFELLVANKSAAGPFMSIGKFQAQNLKLFKTPYQEFTFPAVKAKYLKVKVLSTYGRGYASAREFQLLGNLDK
jgi:hypothetical protein